MKTLHVWTLRTELKLQCLVQKFSFSLHVNQSNTRCLELKSFRVFVLQLLDTLDRLFQHT